jgi:hypothetical protein
MPMTGVRWPADWFSGSHFAARGSGCQRLFRPAPGEVDLPHEQ